ncbi:MAG: hypothetical protein KY475_25885 [Planctomycetes bacterium]|nr:hypothetical protein [Planctomycetota bacterium]
MAGNVSFFTWIREGVKQAVLLGMSDAVHEIGTPDNEDNMSHRLLEVIKNDGKTETAAASNRTSGGRKRLGRSLKEIGAAADK